MVRTGSTFRRVLLFGGLVVLLVFFLARFRQATGPDDTVSMDGGTMLALSGQTMGTSYRVLLPASALGGNRKQVLSDAVSTRLFHLDRELMSTYAPDSELSRFNAMPAGQSMTVSPELAVVINTASRVHALSDGAFDITILPLVELWGFGPSPEQGHMPTDAGIAAARERMGMDKFTLSTAGKLSKSAPVSLDLSAIAKGYAVDAVAGLLAGQGIDHYLVEIGGEIASKGRRPDGSPWRLGIEAPADGQPSLYQALETGAGTLALAGSGSYRNFRLLDGNRYSHTIDPATGRPVTHNLSSVTVVAKSAMLADAWATALLVMGPEAGMKRANELQLAAYFIKAGTEGFQASHSKAFNQYLPDDF